MAVQRYIRPYVFRYWKYVLIFCGSMLLVHLSLHGGEMTSRYVYRWATLPLKVMNLALCQTGKHWGMVPTYENLKWYLSEAFMSQCPLQMSLKAKPRQTFSKGLPLTVHGIKASLRYHFRFSCVVMKLSRLGAMSWHCMQSHSHWTLFRSGFKKTWLPKNKDLWFISLSMQSDFPTHTS